MSKLITVFMLLSLMIFANQGKLFVNLKNTKSINDVFDNYLLNDVKNKKNISFKIKKAIRGNKNTEYFHFGYTFKGILVENQTFVIAQKDKKPYLLAGNFNVPEISNLRGKYSAVNVFKHFRDSTRKFKFFSDIKKVIVVKNGNTFLTYKALVEYADKKGYHLGVLYMDANNYKKVLFKSHIYEAINRQVYTFNNQCLATQDSYDNLPGYMELGEGDDLGTDNVVNDAYVNLGITYWFYKNMLDRDSFDDNGIPLISTVHARFDFGDGYGCVGDNAFFMGEPYNQMVYGDGGDTMNYLSQGLDVTAHELTHAVTDRTSNLYYHGESGALNEAMSDIFGATTEAWGNSGGTASGNPANFIPDENTWKIGEDIMTDGSAMRYMNNPHLADGPDEYKPDHYTQRYIGDYDEGGVHINSTIISLAYYLLVSGGNHPRAEFQNLYPDVQGLGLEKSIKIFYYAQTHWFTGDENFSFSDARRLLSQSAEDLYGNCSDESEQVNRAFDIVGVPGNRKDECNNVTSCDGITCSNHGTCNLVNGHAVCNCDADYHAAGLNCVADSQGSCTPQQEAETNCSVLPHAHCDIYQQDGNAYCFCDTGYHVNDDQTACVEDANTDVCAGVDCNQYYPNSVCIDNGGSAGCSCPSGWKWNENQTECIEDIVNPCDGVACSNHGTCIVNNNGEASCNCDEGYHVDNSLNCIEDVVNPCDGVDCSNHGTCIVNNNGEASCNCDEGYHADNNLNCIENVVNPCDGVACSNHGTCIVNNNGEALCNCDEGYHVDNNLSCIEDEITDPCDDFDCSEYPNTHCINYQGHPTCKCDEGFHLNENKTACIQDASDLCEGINCSNHGECRINNNEAYCECDEGYQSGDNLSCIEVTVDLCKDVTCSEHGLCAVSENKANCVCDEGFTALGLTCVKDSVNDSKNTNSSSCNYINNSDNTFLFLLIVLSFLLIIRRKYSRNI